MRRQHPAIPKKTVPATTMYNTHPIVTPVMGDSLEVMEVYHQEKVQVLERTLRQLNLLDNAREIAFICREVVLVKEALNSIYLKKKFMA